MAYNPLHHYLFDYDENPRGSLTGLMGFLSGQPPNPPRLVGMTFIWGQRRHIMGTCDGDRVDFYIDGPGGEYIDAVGIILPPVPVIPTTIMVKHPPFLATRTDTSVPN
jgi:hypothetical protein